MARKKNLASPVASDRPERVRSMQSQHPDEKTRKVMVASNSTTIKTPLPPPAWLREYDAIVPGMGLRLLEHMERQSKHRQDMERFQIRTDALLATSGSFFAFCLGVLGTGGGILLAYNGRDITGLAAMLLSLSTLAGAFIYRQKVQSQERLEQIAARKKQ